MYMTHMSACHKDASHVSRVSGMSVGMSMTATSVDSNATRLTDAAADMTCVASLLTLVAVVLVLMPMLILLSVLSAHSTRRLLPGSSQVPYCDTNCTNMGDLLHIGIPWQMLWLLYLDAPVQL